MAVNEITKNFLVYAIRDFFIRGGSCHAVLEYVFPKKIYYPNILHNTIKRRDFIFSRFKKYPVYLIKKNTICISKAPLLYTTTMRLLI